MAAKKQQSSPGDSLGIGLAAELAAAVGAFTIHQQLLGACRSGLQRMCKLARMCTVATVRAGKNPSGLPALSSAHQSHTGCRASMLAVGAGKLQLPRKRVAKPHHTCQQARTAEVVVHGPAPVAAQGADAHSPRRRRCRRRIACASARRSGGGVCLCCGRCRQLPLLLDAQAALATPAPGVQDSSAS